MSELWSQDKDIVHIKLTLTMFQIYKLNNDIIVHKAWLQNTDIYSTSLMLENFLIMFLMNETYC